MKTKEQIQRAFEIAEDDSYPDEWERGWGAALRWVLDD